MSAIGMSLLRRLTPIVAALVVFAAILQAIGYPGAEVLGDIVRGSVGTPNALLQTVRWTVPLVLVGLGAVISFRSGFFNVGGLGQFYLGAIAAAWVSTTLTAIPAPLAIALSIVAGIAAGAVWALVPGILRVYFRADEVVTTIMLNFVAQFLLLYLVTGPMMDTSATAQGSASAPVPDAFRISDSGGLSPLIIGIVVVVAAVIWVLVNRTSFGVLSGIAGRNALMLKWQGVEVGRIGLTSFGISGALAGLAGAIEILGPSGRLVTGLSPQVGNSAMLVALTAGLLVGGALLSGLFFGALTAASLFLPVAAQLPASAIVVLNGIIALLVTAEFRFRPRRSRKVAAAADPPDPARAPEPAAAPRSDTEREVIL